MERIEHGKLNVRGIGLVSGCGRGVEAHTPDGNRMPCIEEESGLRVLRVDPQTLKDRTVLKGMRRADTFSKLAVLAAHDAFESAGLTDCPDRSTMALIVTTAFGPHHTTFGFLDEILDFGDAEVSPTRFSHSVHNAAASYIATSLDCRGPACTITDFVSPLHAGLRTAEAWLREGRCERALVGYVEELSAPMNYAMATMNASSGAASLQPFNLSPYPDIAASEGAIFLALDIAGPSKKRIELQPFAGADSIADVGSLLCYLETCHVPH